MAGESGDESSAKAHARVGGVLNDKWKLERLLGVGGMGAVYSGLHRNGARAAVKVLHQPLARHEEVRSRFLREGYAANRVEHPSVVKVLDDDIVVGGADDGTAYLVMELLVGESLESLSQRGVAISEHDFLRVAEVVLEALDVAHRSGVVHRDIKPDNIFVTQAGEGRDRIKVLDFGLARLLEGRSMTVHGIALGTPPFMSPEQAAGCNDEIDGRTDLFALAASGFRLITGRRIHEGTSTVDLVHKMGKLAAPRVRAVAPQVSEALASVLDRALEFRREDRYESAAAMRADVLRALAVVDVGAPVTRSLGDAVRDMSMELSASDLERIRSVELSEIEVSHRIELSASDLEVPVPQRPAPVFERMPFTQPLPGAPPLPVTLPLPVVARLAPTEPMLLAPLVLIPPAPPPPIVVAPRRRSPFVRACVGFVVVCAGAVFALGWLTESAPAPASAASLPAAAASPSTNISPASTSRLAVPRPSPDERGTKPGKRTKH